MPKIAYVERQFSAGSHALIEQANEIIAEYGRQGFDLTLRQLYYQFVSRGYIANKDTEYKRLGSVINDARLAGLIDWNAITDRTRNIRSVSHWETPDQIIESAAASFRIDKWSSQSHRVEVWIEKDALVGVIDGVCRELDTPYFSCRGYTSQSEMWAAAQRLLGYIDQKQEPVIIHLGDHDPSGKDMTRDIKERLTLFCARDIDINRIALNMSQIRRYNPPPNPAKITDSRAGDYIRRYGNESWELDALDPTTLADLIRSTIAMYRDDNEYTQMVDLEKRHRAHLRDASRRWEEIERLLARPSGTED